MDRELHAMKRDVNVQSFVESDAILPSGRVKLFDNGSSAFKGTYRFKFYYRPSNFGFNYVLATVDWHSEKTNSYT